MVLGESGYDGRSALCSGVREGSGGRMLEVALKCKQSYFSKGWGGAAWEEAHNCLPGTGKGLEVGQSRSF